MEKECTFGWVMKRLESAAEYWEQGDLEKSLAQFDAAERMVLRLAEGEMPCEMSFRYQIARLINYGIGVYRSGNQWVKEAERIYLFLIRIINMSPQDLCFEKGSVLYNLGVVYIEHDRTEEAYKAFLEADGIMREVHVLPGYMSEALFYQMFYSNLFNLALSSQKLLNYEEAEKYYKLAVCIQYEILDRDDLELIAVMFRLVELYLEQHQTDKASKVMDAVAAVGNGMRECPASVYHEYLFYYCAILDQKDMQEDMLKIISGSYQWMEETHASVGIRYRFLQTEYDGWMELGRLDECLRVTDEIRALMEAEPDGLAVGRKELYKMRAEILDEQGNMEEALHNFRQSMLEYEKEEKKDVWWEISYWSSLSLAYIHGYHYNEAKEALCRIIASAEKISVGREEYKFALLPAYLNMGLVYMRMMEYDKAEHYLFAALNLCGHKDGGKGILRDELKIFINLAWLYLSMWQFERAVYYARMAMQMIDDIPHIGKQSYYVEICQVLSMAYARQGNEKEGLRWIDEAIALKGDSASVSLCRCLCLKGIILRHMDPAASREFQRAALDMLCELKMENTHLFLEILANKMGGEEHIRMEDVEALKAAADNSSLPDSYYKLNVFADIVRGSMSVGKFEDALYYSARALGIYKLLIAEALEYDSVENLVNYKRDMRLFYQLFFVILLDESQDLSDIPENSPLLSWMQNYKIGDYYLLRQVRRQLGDDETDRYHLASELNYLNFMSEFCHENPEMEHRHRLLLKRAEADYRSHGKEVYGRLPEDPEQYEGFWCMDYYCPEEKGIITHAQGFVIVWQYTKPQNKRVVRIGSVASIKEGILQLRDAVIRDQSTQSQEQNLYRLLLEPVMQEMPYLKDVRQFIICPDGMLALVPFEILMGTDSRILYIPFMGLLCMEKKQGGGKAVVGGSPVITKENPFGLFPLQYSEEECDRAADALRSVGYTVEILSGNGENRGLSFSKDNFLGSIEKEPVSILHISSHGFYREQENLFLHEGNHKEGDNPYRRCGIIMNDVTGENGYCFAKSVVSGEDILRMDLKNMRLVVLSTCVSGLGNAESGEWLIGLQRAFMMAGAENMIVSLWEVEEESTAILMDCFYGYIKEGMAIDMALGKAKMDLIRYQGGIYSTPYYWAGFVYIGRIQNIG